MSQLPAEPPKLDWHIVQTLLADRTRLNRKTLGEFVAFCLRLPGDGEAYTIIRNEAQVIAAANAVGVDLETLISQARLLLDSIEHMTESEQRIGQEIDLTLQQPGDFMFSGELLEMCPMCERTALRLPRSNAQGFDMIHKLRITGAVSAELIDICEFPKGERDV